MSSYFIKEGYKINSVNITNDQVSNTSYWNRDRIMAAASYQLPVYDYVLNYLNNNRVESIIDIGCGVGRKLEYIHKRKPEVKITGIDQKGAIDYCNANYKFGTWFADDFDNPCLAKDLVADLVICSDVIEHVNDPDRLLAYVRSKMSPDGVAVISTPERDILRGADCFISPNLHHVREWNSAEFLSYLEHNGFQIMEHLLQLPVRLELSKIAYREIFKRVLRFKAIRYNQVVLVRVA